MREALTIGALRPDEQLAVKSLLASCRLPSSDLETSEVELLAARRDASVEGAIGIQRFESVALLRSLVVAESARGLGVGADLVQALEHFARCAGVRQLYLLTTDASAFFNRLGYLPVERQQVPASIRETEQFATLCPSTARCLSKSLDLL